MTSSIYIKEMPMFRMLNAGWGNGYVVLPEGHRFHGMDYDSIMSEVDTCEELTYSEMDENGNWVVGWDSAHSHQSLANYPEEVVLSQTLQLQKELDGVFETEVKDFVDNMSDENQTILYNLIEGMRVKD